MLEIPQIVELCQQYPKILGRTINVDAFRPTLLDSSGREMFWTGHSSQIQVLTTRAGLKHNSEMLIYANLN